MNGTSTTRPAFDLGAPGVPEDCLSIPGQDIPIDLIACCLARADATIAALMADGQTGQFTMNDRLILNALWAASGWVEMARKALNPKAPKPEAEARP